MLKLSIPRRRVSTSVLRLGAALLLCAISMPGPAKAESTLSFGLVSVMAAEENAGQWRPLLNALGRALDGAVVSYTAPDYGGVVSALRSGRVQLAWLGNKSAVEAVDSADVEVFAQNIYPDGAAGYYSVLIVNSASPFLSAEQVLARSRELTLALGDVNSTSGYLVPRLLLFPRLDPKAAFKRLIQGNHEDNFLAVAEGRADAALVASNHLETFGRLHPDRVKAVRIVWRSPSIPADPLVWRRDLPAETKARIARFFTEYGREAGDKPAGQLAEERATLARLGIGRFAPSSNLQLRLIRRLELSETRLSTEVDQSLPDEERNRRLVEIDRQLSSLH